MADQILKLKDVASILKLGQTKTYALAQRGELPGFKIGGQWRFRRDQIERWLTRKSRQEDTILLVEDNADEAELTMRSLSRHSVQNDIVLASDGGEALDYLLGRGRYSYRDVGNLPKVVLLDLKLPKISGFEVLRTIRSDERLKKLPVIVLTGSENEQDQIESEKLGVVAYLPKPVDFSKLAVALRELGFGWLLSEVAQ